jgi:hypothetical protein
MSRQELVRLISRRDAVKLLAGSAATACSLSIVNNGVVRAAAPPARLHSLIQVTTPAGPYTPKFFKSDQMKILGELVEIIIPTDDHSPGAKAARIHEYIDELVFDAAPADKELWTQGLEAVERMAHRDPGRAFLLCSPEQQFALVEEIGRSEERPQTLEERFFKALKNATVNGYYTSAIGIHEDLQYLGNDYLNEFPGCGHPEHGGK